MFVNVWVASSAMFILFNVYDVVDRIKRCMAH